MSQANQTVTLVVSADPGTTAQFSVTIDGVQEGTFTTNADDSTGQTDTINITGDFGASGPQQVDVTFLNDQFADMFVHSVDVNGHVFAGSTAQNGANPQQFTDPNDPTDAPMTADGTAVFNTAGSPPSTHTVTEDFNGDGTSDIPAEDSSGNVFALLMNQGNVSSQVQLAGGIPSSWHSLATGDFAGDGNADVLWQNDDGTVGIWQMNGTTIAATADPAVLGPSWHFLGTGDFDGDGKTDILWQNDNGTVGIWQMNGTAIAASGDPAVVGPSWHYRATGDFGGDGKSDIVWQNDDGTVGIWQMNGMTIASSADPAVVNSSWHLIGTGDFNGDGKADILWLNDNGTLGIWQMNGTSIAQSVDVTGATIAPGSHIIDIGNFQGNAISDILVADGNGQVSLLTLDQNEHATVSTVHAGMTDLHLM